MNDRELAKLAHAAVLNAQLIHIHLATALTTIAAKLDDLDGYPSTASGADTGPHGHSETSITERTAINRLGDPSKKRAGISYQRDELEDWILTASKAYKNALAIMDRFTGIEPLTPTERKRLRCIGTGDATGSTCEEWADLHRGDGRCINCGPTVDRAVKAERERKRYQERKGAA